jgi:hypothetical protein
MIPKNGNRFSDRIMLKQKDSIRFDSTQSGQTLSERYNKQCLRFFHPRFAGAALRQIHGYRMLKGGGASALSRGRECIGSIRA